MTTTSTLNNHHYHHNQLSPSSTTTTLSPTQPLSGPILDSELLNQRIMIKHTSPKLTTFASMASSVNYEETTTLHSTTTRFQIYNFLFLLTNVIKFILLFTQPPFILYKFIHFLFDNVFLNVIYYHNLKTRCN